MEKHAAGSYMKKKVQSFEVEAKNTIPKRLYHAIY